MYKSIYGDAHQYMVMLTKIALFSCLHQLPHLHIVGRNHQEFSNIYFQFMDKNQLS